jgi:hypothetical protein
MRTENTIICNKPGHLAKAADNVSPRKGALYTSLNPGIQPIAAAVLRLSLAAFLGVSTVTCLPVRDLIAQEASTKLSIADDQSFTHQSDAEILRRFSLYREAGIGTLRAGISWRDETPDGHWRPTNERWLKLAVSNGFRLKIELETISGPPAWFLEQNPEARIVNGLGEYSRNLVSYWYPGLYDLVVLRTDMLVHWLHDQNMLPSVDSVILDTGPAGEAIYPAAWTQGPGHTDASTTFWFYGPSAEADVRRTMQRRYGNLAAANARWGTSFAEWREVGIPLIHSRPRTMWSDILEWYRDRKRTFVRRQIENTRETLLRYGPRQPTLLLLLPGSHMRDAEWTDAVEQGDGDLRVKLMVDTDFLIQTAHQNKLGLQFTAMPNDAELSYITNYMKSHGVAASLWGENVGDPQSGANLAELLQEVAKWRLFGFEYVNSGFLFDQYGAKPSALWYPFVSMYKQLRTTFTQQQH